MHVRSMMDWNIAGTTDTPYGGWLYLNSSLDVLITKGLYYHYLQEVVSRLVEGLVW